MYYSNHSIASDLESLRRDLNAELDRIASVLQSMVTPFVQLSETNVAPSKPREGMVAFADGTNWNPGSGRGVYVYSSSAWVKL